MNKSSKTEKPLTQKEADRLYFIGLMNPSDEDLKYWDSTYDESMKENIKEAMNMGQTEWEQEMSLEDALLEGARKAKRPQEEIDSEVSDYEKPSRTEKPLTQKEADRLYFIGLMNPSDEDLKDWDLRYDESMKENE